MSIQKVREYFKQFGIEDRIREFDVSSATVELAAVAVGVEGARIAKSLSFKVEDKPIIIVVAGDAKVDNAKFKNAFHTKAKMLTPEEVDNAFIVGMFSLLDSMLGIPMELYTPLFAVARIMGWSAHRIEELLSANKIIRPAYKNVLEEQSYLPIADR
mgnify:CR=1 FL=1